MAERRPNNKFGHGRRKRWEGCREPGSAREIPNNEKCPRNTMQPTKKTIESKGPKKMEVDGNIQKGGGEAASASVEKALGLNGSAEKGMDTLPNEGRGDPTSTMMWSPRKHASQKRSLEVEEEVSDNETSDEEEAMLEGSQEEINGDLKANQNIKRKGTAQCRAENSKLC